MKNNATFVHTAVTIVITATAQVMHMQTVSRSLIVEPHTIIGVPVAATIPYIALVPASNAVLRFLREIDEKCY